MQDLNGLDLPDLYAALTRGGAVHRLLELARAEDLGEGPRDWGDITSRVCIDESASGEAHLRSRQRGVISGLRIIPEALRIFAPDVRFEAHAEDGDTPEPGRDLGTLRGPVRGILAAERTILNLIGRMSGIASLTRRYVHEVTGTGAHIYDTRKTTPGMRALEKYAVRCGGGFCHRFGLYDAVLIKDNHLAGAPAEGLGQWLAGRAAAAREMARRNGRILSFIEVEVDTPEQLEQVFAAIMDGASIDIILLDNFTPEMLRNACKRRVDLGLGAPGGGERPMVRLEASGGVNLETVGEIAHTGVDRISVGALTHQATSLDVGLDIDGPKQTPAVS